jgi:hypothetical protein
MSNLYRGSSVDASYQDSVHLAQRFQRRILFLEINQSETRIVCGGHVSWPPQAILVSDWSISENLLL